SVAGAGHPEVRRGPQLGDRAPSRGRLLGPRRRQRQVASARRADHDHRDAHRATPQPRRHRRPPTSRHMTVFIRATAAQDKAKVLRETGNYSGRRYVIDIASLGAVPGSPFSYWVSDRMRAVFRKFAPFEAEMRSAKVGLQTSDNFRFCRAWWETPANSKSDWKDLVLGGGVSAFYYRLDLRARWVQEGQEVKAFAERTAGTTHWSRRVTNSEFYGVPGFTWGLRTRSFKPACVPARCIFTVSRYQAFVFDEDPSVATLALVGLLNGSAVSSLLR